MTVEPLVVPKHLKNRTLRVISVVHGKSMGYDGLWSQQRDLTRSMGSFMSSVKFPLWVSISSYKNG